MASNKINNYTVHFSQDSCPEVREILIKDNEITLSESSLALGKGVDFVTRDYGIVYVTEKEMNGKVKNFLPRILTLIYQHKYLKSQGKLDKKDDYPHGKKFGFRKKIVYIHYHEDNSEKALSLPMFLTDHKIPHVLVQDAVHVAKLIKYISKSVYPRFIISSSSALNND
eukprot:UN05961